MNIKKLFNILITILIIVLLTAPSAEAWNIQTHIEMMDEVYHALPADVQRNLNLSIMENATTDLDKKYRDFGYHSYPKSYDEAVTWLNKGKAAYDKGDYDKASYDYGVAIHYISDTFSAPHGVSDESPSEHSHYEDMALNLKPNITYKEGDLQTQMQQGYINGGKNWNEWLTTRNSSIIQGNLNNGTSVSYYAIRNSIDSNQSVMDSFYYGILNFFTLV